MGLGEEFYDWAELEDRYETGSRPKQPIRYGCNSRINKAVGKLTRLLAAANLPVEITAVAATGSTYLFFPKHPHMGKIRVGDHNERKRYGYRWQIRIDMNNKKKYVDKKKGHARYFYSDEALYDAVTHMIAYNRKAEASKHSLEHK